MARVLWLKRNHRELNSETRRLDQDLSGALRRLTRSKGIRRAHESRRTHRNKLQLGLIRRPVGRQTGTPARRSRETLQLLESPTSGQDLGNGPSADCETEERRRRDRFDALYLKLTDGKLTPEEEPEFNNLFDRDPRWHPARIEDHPLYEAHQAYGRVVEEGKQADLLRKKVRHE
jgi:hypothetical protein